MILDAGMAPGVAWGHWLLWQTVACNVSWSCSPLMVEHLVVKVPSLLILGLPFSLCRSESVWMPCPNHMPSVLYRTVYETRNMKWTLLLIALTQGWVTPSDFYLGLLPLTAQLLTTTANTHRVRTHIHSHTIHFLPSLLFLSLHPGSLPLIFIWLFSTHTHCERPHNKRVTTGMCTPSHIHRKFKEYQERNANLNPHLGQIYHCKWSSTFWLYLQFLYYPDLF